MRGSVLSVVLACLPSSASLGQSINVDYGAGGPPADYGAAGLPGTWNVVTGGPHEAQALVNLMGEPTAATISHNLGAPFLLNDQATMGNDERLLDDGLGDMGDVVVTLELDGLMNGTYELIVYGWTPTVPTDMTLIILNEELGPVLLAGGPWPGGLEQDITHVVTEVEVTGGAMTIGAVGGYWGASGFLNGLQLRRLTPQDLNDDGMVTVTDLLELLGVWGACQGEGDCRPDFDGDGLVGIQDLLQMLAAWG